MPEIPDLEAIRGFLNQRLPGAAVERAEYLIPVVFRVPKEEFVRMLEGATFGETRRRGKFLVFHLESGQRLVINAMLTGRFQYLRPDVKRRAKTCLVLGLANGWDLRYADDRLMGKVYLVTEDGLGAVPQWSEMGPDALEVTKEEFAQQIRKFTGQIKNVLVNHRFVAGIGNAYADEILFAARIHPYRRRTTLSEGDVDRLYDSMLKVFAWATPIVAEQMREELNYEERRDFLKIHRKGGDQCPVCGTRISEITAGQRITNFCRNCQPG
ncbi:MAG: DNA-formamidopyrimidine glycosylase family protein [Dehalococcoidia bacterium]|nr:DNA-formamidopyrimidine glycosylase family protein [Dehalococcoidia bacterium]